MLRFAQVQNEFTQIKSTNFKKGRTLNRCLMRQIMIQFFLIAIPRKAQIMKLKTLYQDVEVKCESI